MSGFQYIELGLRSGFKLGSRSLKLEEEKIPSAYLPGMTCILYAALSEQEVVGLTSIIKLGARFYTAVTHIFFCSFSFVVLTMHVTL